MEVESEGEWWDAEILKIKHGQFKIHYVGGLDDEDEWIDIGRYAMQPCAANGDEVVIRLFRLPIQHRSEAAPLLLSALKPFPNLPDSDRLRLPQDQKSERAAQDQPSKKRGRLPQQESVDPVAVPTNLPFKKSTVKVPPFSNQPFRSTMLCVSCANVSDRNDA